MPKYTPEEAAKLVADGLNLGDLSGATGGSGVAPGGRRRNAQANPLASIAEDDAPVALLDTTPVPPQQVPGDSPSEAPSVLPEGYSFGDAWVDAAKADSLVYSLHLKAQEAGFPIDENWQLPDRKSEEWKELTEGIPEEFQENLAETVSLDHAKWKADRIRGELGNEARLYEYGGTLGRIGLSIINPENIAVTLATLGAGAVVGGGSATAAAGRAALTARNIGRAEAFARAGGRAAAANVAYDAAHIASTETRDPAEVAFSAGAGLLLGGTIGSLGWGLTTKERARFLGAARKELREQATQFPPGTEFVPAFGPDSAGAARAGSTFRPLVDDAQLNAGREVPRLSFGGDSKAGILRRYLWRDTGADILDVEDRELRNTIGGYYADPVGSSDGTTVRLAANEDATTTRARWRFQVSNEYEPAWNAWARESGASRWDAFARREFGEAVTLHRLGYAVSDNPHIVKAAKAMDTFYENALKEAREAGVKGVADVKTGPYRPRVWLKTAVTEFSTPNRFGAANIERLIARGFQAANPDVSDEIAEKIGRGIATKLRRSNAGMTEVTVGFRQADGEWLRELVREINADGSLDDVEDYLKRAFSGMLDKSGRGTEGAMPHQKHRVALDESVFLDLTDNADGSVRRLHLYDLFDNDAGELADIYGHRMSGAVGFARQAGVTDKADHQRLLDQVKSHFEAKGDVERGTKVAESMDEIYKLAHGQSLVSQTEPWYMARLRNFTRSMRDLAFSARMNMMWVAALPDSSSWLVNAQAKRLLRNLPELRDAVDQMRKGNFDNNLLGEILTNTGIATEGVANDVMSAFDDDLIRQMLGRNATGLQRVSNAAARFLRKANRVTSHVGGVYWKQNFDQKLFGYAYAHRVIDNAMGLSDDLNPKRLASAGLDKAMLKRIKAQVEAFSDMQSPGKGVKIKTLNTDAWTDKEAARALWGAVAREGRRSVQSENYGEAPRWMNQWWGKMFGQFRRFGLVAQTKQLLYGIKHGDAETIQRVLMYQLPLGALGYAAQMTAYSFTQPDPQAFRDKYLTPGHIMWAGVARAGFVGLLPAVAQGTWESATGTSINSNLRVSGSGTSFLDPNSYPALDMMWRFMKAGESVAQSALRGDRQFDQKEFRNLRGVMPLNNAPGVKQILDTIQNMLPEKDVDENPDETEWFN